METKFKKFKILSGWPERVGALPASGRTAQAGLRRPNWQAGRTVCGGIKGSYTFLSAET